MANLTSPKFVSGSTLVIKITDADHPTSFVVAYATNLSFQHNMAATGVQVIGAFANQAVEPLGYTAGGSFTLLNYTDGGKQKDVAGNKPTLSASADQTITNAAIQGMGSKNSLLAKSHMSPRKLLLSTTFDIDVYLRTASGATFDASTDLGQHYYTIYDCRLTDWSIAFAPGQLASERVSFMARGVRLQNIADANETTNEGKKGDSTNF